MGESNLIEALFSDRLLGSRYVSEGLRNYTQVSLQSWAVHEVNDNPFGFLMMKEIIGAGRVNQTFCLAVRALSLDAHQHFLRYRINS